MALSFPEIDPVAFSLGPVDIRWYALAYLAGFLLGWRYALALARGCKKDRAAVGNGPDTNDIDDFLPWAILGVIVGGRLGYILFYNAAYYMEEPLTILKVWQGGMSFHGGLCGLVVALITFSCVRGISVFRFADIVACVAPIGIFFGRTANFINGELYGRVTDMPWGIIFPGGGPWPRHPSQLYEAALEGILLGAIMFAFWRYGDFKNRPGFLTGVFLAGYGMLRILVEMFREPDAHIGFIIGEFISMGQILSLPMVAAGLGLSAYAILRKSDG